MFDPRKSSSHPLLLSDILIYLFQKSTCNHSLLHVQCIGQIFLSQEYCYFRGVLTAIGFEWIVSILEDLFQFLFRVLCFFETSTGKEGVFSQRNWLIWYTSCSHPFLEGPLFYYKIAVVAIHSFKFTIFFFRMEVPARRYHSFQLNYQLW